MKKIFNVFALAAGIMLSLTGCNSDETFTTAGPNDTPRFLAPSEIINNLAADMNQKRDEEFSMDVVVTPADYVTINWIADGHILGTGASFSKTFETGQYELHIEATTKAGKLAYRIINLTVDALPGDPAIDKAPSNLWMNPGVAFSLKGSGLSEVASLIFTPVGENEDCYEVRCAPNEDGTAVSFVLPEDMNLSDYRVSAVGAEGMRYGLGVVTVSADDYQEPGMVKKILWQGCESINWGDNNVVIPAEALADVEVGTTIYVKYNVPEAEYHSLRITTPWWGDNAEDDLVLQFDITEETGNPFAFVYTAACKALVEERGGMLLVGFGYDLQEVYYEAAAMATREITLWEGAESINWGDNNVAISADQLADVEEGATICLYYDVPDADYHALRITTPWWGDNAEDDLVLQFDITEDTPNPYEFKYTAACKALVEERGGMLIVGFGYNLKKVTVK